MRRILSRFRLGWAALPFRVVAPLTVSVMWGPPSGICPDPCQAGMAVCNDDCLSTDCLSTDCLSTPPLRRRIRDLGTGACGGIGTSVAVPLAQGGDLIFEVGERLEPSVDRGE